MSQETGSITLSSGASVKINTGPANYLFAYQLTDLALVQLRKNGQTVEEHNVVRKLPLNGKDFDEIIVKDKSGSNNTFRFFYGQGEYLPPADGAEVGIDDTDPIDVNMVNGSITVNESLPNEVLALADVTVTNSATTLAAADSTSLEVLVSIPASETDGIRVGENGNVATNRGLYMGPGDFRVFTLSNHELSAIRESGASGDVTVTVMKLCRV